ncbi:hypothetical protein L228DRAFT_32965 [Xylona heveae TC161]|uniref:Tetraspanin Tsp3 n=1 Tax=Xylona heveae (strain CBS 132557 / TC161) TaxID=1328760 RepID=A0A165A5H4_XYLHT|nr:hypothetical protein L228DRAFT_32965 [Xylona heveae TC161]KZF19979.1 hypothetical protein L228DRAFT_32965 [Xylona heveae TC161]
MRIYVQFLNENTIMKLINIATEQFNGEVPFLLAVSFSHLTSLILHLSSYISHCVVMEHMASKTRNVFLLCTPLTLIALIALSGYAFHTIRRLSLPVSSYLALTTTVLPAIAAFGGCTAHVLARCSRENQRGSTIWSYASQLLIAIILLMYETVVATLSLSHIVPVSSLRCQLDDKWLALFQRKKTDAIRRIQDSHQCCGLHSVMDKAFPFPAKDVEPDACTRTFGWKKSCFQDWQHDEQVMASLLLLVSILMFIGTILAVFLWQLRPTWARYFFHPHHSDSRRYAAIEEQQDDVRHSQERTVDRYFDSPTHTS